MKRELIYITDPMCSWCWGFSPELEKVKDKYEPKWSYRMIMGGLRPCETQPLDDKTKTTIKNHWKQVGERTDQPFHTQGAIDKDDFVYDTEVACRAVVTARHIDPSSEMAMFNDIQKAFFEDGLDTNDINTYLSIAKGNGLEADEFVKRFKSDEIIEATQVDFYEAKQHEARGFPTLICRFDDTYYMIARGWRPFEEIDLIIPKIEEDMKNPTLKD